MNPEITEPVETEEVTPRDVPEEAVSAEETPAEKIPAAEADELMEQEQALLAVTDRLAADFLLLSEEFPEFSSPALLPESVLQTAAQEGIPLLDAYLRYRWQEEKAARRAAEQRASAAKASAGPLGKGAQKSDPGPEGFLRAFRAALR